jgi:hypothetical protein
LENYKRLVVDFAHKCSLKLGAPVSTERS